MALTAKKKSGADTHHLPSKQQQRGTEEVAEKQLRNGNHFAGNLLHPHRPVDVASLECTTIKRIQQEKRSLDKRGNTRLNGTSWKVSIK
jgi:hypothetical protein